MTGQDGGRLEGQTRRFGRAWLALTAAALALAMTVTLGSEASAQVPAAPRPAESCIARLVLSPNPAVFGIGRLIAGKATGLDQSSAYNVFVGSTRVSSGVTDETGTAFFNLDFDSVISSSIEVQVASATRCARTPLVIAGPASLRCVIIPGERIVCPFGDLPFDR